MLVNGGTTAGDDAGDGVSRKAVAQTTQTRWMS